MSINESNLDLDPLLQRWVWILIPIALSLLPFGNAIREGSMVGTGPDVISSVWAMWWFQQEWSSGAWGAHSTIFNFPWGGQGAILSPMSAIVWSIFDGIFGPAWATTVTTWLMLVGTMSGMLFLGQSFQLNRVALGAMMLMCLLPRYIIFTLGETGVVGVAMIPLLIGLSMIVRLERKDRLRSWVLLMLMMGLQGVENPYLAPLLPIALVIQIIRLKRWKWCTYLLGGVVTMAAVVLLFRGASGDYESVRPSSYTQIFGLYFPAIERPWARTDWTDLLISSSILWPAGSMDSIHIQGREYLGLSGLVIGLYGFRYPSLRIWIALAFTRVVLTTGSDWGGSPSPFGLLNSIADVLVRPFTQPSRYFVLYTIGMGVSIGKIIDRLDLRGLICWGVLILEALIWGGLSLRMPTTPVPSSECLAVEFDGPVLIWPWDGSDDQWFESSLKSRLFQLQHEQSGATIATGSWALRGTVFPGKRLRDIGWRKAMDRQGKLQISQLYDWGYRYVIVDETAGRVLSKTARDDVFGLHNRIEDCSNYDVYRLQK